VKSGRLEEGDEAALLWTAPTFYAEQGGQIGDQGFIATPTGRFEVEGRARSSRRGCCTSVASSRARSRLDSRRRWKSAGAGRTHAQPHRDAPAELGPA